MLSPRKFAPLAAIAVAAILFGATGSMSTASAQTGVKLAQADVKTTTRVTTTKRKPTASSQPRSRQTVTKRTTTRTVVRSNSNRSHNTRVVVRSQPSVAFVVLGPRVVYRSYGAGWCRGLHSGRHWAPRIGWHRGRHVGAVRCG